MRLILQIRTRTVDVLADQCIGAGESTELRRETIDLTIGPPDYDGLVEAIFRADQIQVW